MTRDVSEICILTTQLKNLHGRFVQDKAEFVGWVGDHSKLDELRFQPPPRRLTPHHQIIMLVGFNQELVHIRPLHQCRGSLSHLVSVVSLQSSSAKIQQSVIQIQHHQRLALSRWIDEVHLCVLGEFFEILSIGNMVEPFAASGLKADKRNDSIR